jgi:hypothetical protein
MERKREKKHRLPCGGNLYFVFRTSDEGGLKLSPGPEKKEKEKEKNRFRLLITGTGSLRMLICIVDDFIRSEKGESRKEVSSPCRWNLGFHLACTVKEKIRLIHV